MNEYNDCTYEGCMKPGRVGGLCQGHRMQARRGMELRPLRGYATRRPMYCSFEGCDRGHFGNGYCEAHNYQHKTGQKLKPVRKYKKRHKKEEQG